MGEQSRRIGGYEVLARLGSGSVGTVYRAKQLAMDRLVALKVLNPSHAEDPQYVERFLAEARTAARVNHPNVCRVYDVGEDRGLYYFSMELVDGPSVADVLGERGKLPVGEALLIAREMALALGAADAQGLVHGDVKPANILLSDTGVAKLVEVGLAKDVVSLEATAALEDSGLAGTPHYMAPERAQGLDVDIRSDIYSLGATLYHMLVGEPPFTGPHATAVIIKHASEPLKAPSEVVPGIPRRVSALVERMMAKDPYLRYVDPDGLTQDIDAAIGGGPAAGGRRALPGVAVPSAARAHKATSVRRPVRDRSPKGKGAVLVPAAIGGGGVVVAGLLIAIFAFSGPSGVYKRGDERLRHAELLLQEGTFESLGEALAVSRRVARTLPAGDAYERLRDRAERIAQLVERKILDAEKERMKDLIDGVRAGRTTPDAAEAAVAALEGRYGEQDASPVLLDCISSLCNNVRSRLVEAGRKVAVAGRGSRGDPLRRRPAARGAPLEKPGATAAPPAKRTFSDVDAGIPKDSAIAVAPPDLKKPLATGRRARRPAATETPPDPARGREARARLLAEIDSLIGRGAHAAALARVEEAVADPAFEDFTEELIAVHSVCDSLAARRKAVRGAVAKHLEKDIEVRTTKGRLSGEVERLSDHGFILLVKKKLRGMGTVETRARLKWSDLTPEQEDAFARRGGWKARGRDGAVVRAYVALAREDRAAAGRALAEAGDHPLAARVRRRIDAPKREVAERAARAAWREIERAARAAKMSAAEARRFIARVEAFEKRHRDTDFTASVKDRAAAMKRRARWLLLPRRGLVAHWPLDEKEGGTVRDGSGNGHHGTLHGGPAWEPDGGRVDGALRFDGTGDYVDCGTVPGSAAAISVVFWMKARVTAHQIPVDKNPNGKGGRGWTFKLRQRGGMDMQIGSAGAFTRLTIPWQDHRPVYAPGNWVHVAFTFERGRATVYVDGTERCSKSGITHRVDDTTTSLAIGRPSVAYERERFRGLLDDVRIYDRALSAEEVAALYQAGASASGGAAPRAKVPDTKQPAPPPSRRARDGGRSPPRSRPQARRPSSSPRRDRLADRQRRPRGGPRARREGGRRPRVRGFHRGANCGPQRLRFARRQAKGRPRGGREAPRQGDRAQVNEGQAPGHGPEGHRRGDRPGHQEEAARDGHHRDAARPQVVRPHPRAGGRSRPPGRLEGGGPERRGRARLRRARAGGCPGRRKGARRRG